MLTVKHGQTSEKVTKNPKRVEAGHKGIKNFIHKLEEDTDDAENGSGDNTNTSNETSSPTNNANIENITTTTKLNDTYICGLGMLAVLANGVCVLIACKTSQAKNKKTSQ